MAKKTRHDMSEDILRALDLSQDFAALISGHARILWVNKSLAERFGSSQEDLIGLEFDKLFHPSLKDLSEEILISSVNEGGHRSEMLMSGKDGPFPAFVSSSFISPVSMQSDDFSLLIIASDITREKSMEEEIRKRRKFLYAIISKSPIGIFCLDRDKKITVLNDALNLFLLKNGIDLQIGENIMQYDGNLNDQIMTLIDDGLKGGQDDLDNIPLFSGDKPRPIVHVIGSPLISVSGDIEGLVVLVEDKTEKLRITEKLMEADRLASLGILAAGVAHEVNNPLTGIMGIIGSLKDEATKKGIDKEPFERIQSNLERIRDIVRSLLEFSHKKIDIIKEVDINELVKRTYSFFKLQPGFKWISLEINLTDSIPGMRGDPGHIEHVLQNLILNASQAIKDDGKIIISTDFDPPAGEIIIRVEDNGCGISAEDIDKIFEPFFTTKSPDQGTGLGLAVSYSLIRQHGGSIVVEKTSPKGTTFAIRLPTSK
jgi:two-component system NtrC family sensor kinase